jgi:hypothetical protein
LAAFGGIYFSYADFQLFFIAGEEGEGVAVGYADYAAGDGLGECSIALQE